MAPKDISEVRRDHWKAPASSTIIKPVTESAMEASRTTIWLECLTRIPDRAAMTGQARMYPPVIPVRH